MTKTQTFINQYNIALMLLTKKRKQPQRINLK
jgi:hypothetical protein